MRSRSCPAGCENIQPMCACSRPRSWPPRPPPNPWWGLCGSPSLSECAWWVRWSTAQVMAEPCTAIEPKISRPALSGFTASKALWVSMRWNPIVMPKPQNT